MPLTPENRSVDGQLLTVKDIATYLQVNDRTVLKLVVDGKLPAVKVGNQWRFRRNIVDAWLDDQMLGITPPVLDGALPSHATPVMLELASCFEPRQVITHVTGTSKTSVIEQLAVRTHELGLVRDSTWFMGALIERENVLPSANRHGTAFLHTLRRNPGQVSRPFMVLGRSHAGVDFGAPDGKPTHLFFVLGLKYEELYLPWLSKLTQMVAEPGAVQAVLEAPSAEAVYEALAASERGL
jgi:excisionase family DNA binding protein